MVPASVSAKVLIAELMWLLPDIENIQSTWTFADRKRGITIIQLDLELVLKGRKYFREFLFEKFSPLFGTCSK